MRSARSMRWAAPCGGQVLRAVSRKSVEPALEMRPASTGRRRGRGPGCRDSARSSARPTTRRPPCARGADPSPRSWRRRSARAGRRRAPSRRSDRRGRRAASSSRPVRAMSAAVISGRAEAIRAGSAWLSDIGVPRASDLRRSSEWNRHCKYQFNTRSSGMRLTSFTDYGLRMLMRMAGAPERGFSTAELAAEFGLSRHHLTKIMQRLAGAGIVATRRGGGGGAVLAQARGGDPARRGGPAAGGGAGPGRLLRARTAATASSRGAAGSRGACARRRPRSSPTSTARRWPTSRCRGRGRPCGSGRSRR